ncbi:recombinase family protein [Streptomyces nojiriensis]|uniref:recombinase family protein n=1 Tax=Streptomyces nojiriensis TaxID=66374 RepID=UPI0036D808A7
MRQLPQRLDDRGAGRGRAEVDDVGQEPDEPAHRRVPGRERGPPLRVLIALLVRDDLRDDREGFGDLPAGDGLLDRRQRVHHRHQLACVGGRGGLQQHPDRLRHPARRPPPAARFSFGRASGIEDPVAFEEDPGTSSRLHPLQRPKFRQLLTYARPGDTVHISEMFRRVRGTGHILDVLDVLDVLHREQVALRIHEARSPQWTSPPATRAPANCCPR